MPLKPTRIYKQQNPRPTDYSKKLDQKAESWEPRFRRAFFDAIEKIKSDIDEKELARATERGPVVAYRYVQDQVSEEQFQPLQDAFVAAAGAGGAILLGLLAIDEDAAALNEMDRQQYVKNVLQDIESNTIEGVRQALMREKYTASQIMDLIGLTPAQEQAVENYRGMLQSGDRDAFRRSLRDRRHDPTVQRYVAGEEADPEKIEEMVRKYRERYKKHRAQTIARTESIRAIHAGQQNQIEDLIQRRKINAGDIRLLWRPQHDARVRDSHLAIPRQNPEGVEPGQAFQSPLGPIRYPGDPTTPPSNHMNCRCIVFPRVNNG